MNYTLDMTYSFYIEKLEKKLKELTLSSTELSVGQIYDEIKPIATVINKKAKQDINHIDAMKSATIGRDVIGKFKETAAAVGHYIFDQETRLRQGVNPISLKEKTIDVVKNRLDDMTNYKNSAYSFPRQIVLATHRLTDSLFRKDAARCTVECEVLKILTEPLKTIKTDYVTITI